MMRRRQEIPAFDRGVVDFMGRTNSERMSYFVRFTSSETPQERNKSFFAFNLNELTLSGDDTVIAIEMSLRLPVNGYRSPNRLERFSLHALRRDLYDIVLQGGALGHDLFNELTNGPVLGEGRVSNESEGHDIIVPIVPDRIADILSVCASTDARFLITGTLNPSGADADSWLFLETQSLDADAVRICFEIQEF